MQDLQYNRDTLLNGNLLPIVEQFYTIQGEGRFTGVAAYFVRLAGCDVHCPWCDAKESWNPTNFPLLSVTEIVSRILETPARLVVITGGEPMKYPLDPLCNLLRQNNLGINIETSGSEPASGKIDWVCLSPKKRKKPLLQNLKIANELKVVISTPDDFSWAEENAAQVGEECMLFLQPEWNNSRVIMPEIVNYVKNNPKWRISLQTHKFMNVP